MLQTAGIAALVFTARSSRAAGVQLQETDAAAQALGYTANASQVDRAKYPRFAAGQRCANCQFYQGKPADASALCALFGAKQVSGSGWCNAYQARA